MGRPQDQQRSDTAPAPGERSLRASAWLIWLTVAILVAAVIGVAVYFIVS